MSTKLKVEGQDLKSWGEYADACRRFADKVKGLPGIHAVAAKHCGNYVDLWVFTDEAYQIQLIRPVGRALKEIWHDRPQLNFDSFVTRQEIPRDFVVLFKA